MISDTVADAVMALQGDTERVRNTYALERIERALDELLRNPGDSTTPAKHRIRSAMGHAYEVLERRKEIAPGTAIHTSLDEPGYTEPAFHTIEMLDWIRNEPDFTPVDRIVLQSLAAGHDAETLAARHVLPLPKVRQRISRARRAAREARPNLNLVT